MGYISYLRKIFAQIGLLSRNINVSLFYEMKISKLIDLENFLNIETSQTPLLQFIEIFSLEGL